MVDVVSRRCLDPSCMRRPLYNTDGLRPVWCSKHKASGMIDVVSARCGEPVRMYGDTASMMHPMTAAAATAAAAHETWCRWNS